MGLTIEYLSEQAPAPKVRVDARLWATADGKRLVPDGHPEAAVLFCAAGREVAKADFERFELDESLGEVAVTGVEEATPEQPESAEEAAPEEPAPAEEEAPAEETAPEGGEEPQAEEQPAEPAKEKRKG